MTPEAETTVDALAVYRLTVLIVDDLITRGFREAVIVWAYNRAGRHYDLLEPVDDAGQMRPRRTGEQPQTLAPPLAAALIGCHGCVGLWVALAATVGHRCWWWRRLRGPLAWSAVTSLIAERF